jgi:Na+-driven multidrug efflux pump
MTPLVFLIALLVGLIAVVVFANGQKKKGAMSDSTHQMLVSACSIVVTLAAVTVLILRIRG